MSMVNEFREFANRGNLIDLAAGVIIGGAFGKIVSSLVTDIITPPIGLLLGDLPLTDLKMVLKQVEGAPPVTINYGNFLVTMADFIVIAWIIFVFIRVLNSMKRNEEAAPSKPATPPEDVLLLREIRDLLKKT